MDVNNLYVELLGLKATWFITNTEVDSKRKRITVFLGHNEQSQFACACCGQLRPVYDHTDYRTWRHLDTCEFETFLKAKLPRTKCVDCRVKTTIPPWSSGYSRFTEQFECHAIDVLQASQVARSAALLLGITSDQMTFPMKKSVDRGVARREAHGGKINYVAIDEKAYKEGHNYVTVLSDADNARVLEITEGRTAESVKTAYKALNDNQLSQIRGVSMDTWVPFASVTKQVAPQADVIHDGFHLSGYLNNAVDITRRAENKKQMQQDNDVLKGTKYIWLKSEENLSEKDKRTLDEIVQQKELKTVRAFKLKEEFKLFFDAPTIDKATTFFNEWIGKVIDSGNTQLIKVATMFKKHWNGLKTYVTHRITNAIAESLNSRIQ